MFLARSHTGIIRDLSYDNTALGDALHNFCQLTKEFSIPVFCFFEGRPTDYGKKIGIPHVIVQMVGALKSYIRVLPADGCRLLNKSLLVSRGKRGWNFRSTTSC